MQVGDPWDKDILYVQQEHFKASSSAAVESSSIHEGLLGFEVSVLGEECEDPLWFRLCFYGESTKTVFVLELWEEDHIAAAFIGHKRRGQPFLLKCQGHPYTGICTLLFFCLKKNEHSNVCVLITPNIRGRQPVGWREEECVVWRGEVYRDGTWRVPLVVRIQGRPEEALSLFIV